MDERALGRLGYDAFFERGREAAGFGAYDVARVVAQHRESYRVTDGIAEYAAKITGAAMFRAQTREDYPAVGDWVAVTMPDAEHAVIHGVIGRRTVLKRTAEGGRDAQVIAANADVAFIMQAVGRDVSLNRLERYAAAISAGGLEPSILLNKADLATPEELAALEADIRARLLDIGLHVLSAATHDGVDALRDILTLGTTYCFVGSSGVGKSTLINALLERAVQATADIGAKTRRGRHVTTTRELFVLASGAMVIDNPGMRAFGVADAAAGVGQTFDDITELAASCRFPDCAHTGEPGCAVREAVASGALDERQLESYRKLRRENEFAEMTSHERRHKDRAFGKYVKQVLKEKDATRER